MNKFDGFKFLNLYIPIINDERIELYNYATV